MAASGGASKLVCKDLFGYLQLLPPGDVENLYKHPAACLAVFRELPVLAKHWVIRMLFLDKPLPQNIINSWAVEKHRRNHLASMQTLEELKVFSECSVTGGVSGWKLNDSFRRNLRIALTGGGQSWLGVCEDADKYAKDASFLETYANQRWECVLQYLVGMNRDLANISATAVSVLRHGRLVDDSSGDEVTVTPAGFQFLLMERGAQVWYFMLLYLEVAPLGLDASQCLQFLFRLSFSTFGQDYSTEGMSEAMLDFLQNLREFGLVYQRKRASKRFYPTRLAVNISSSAPTPGASSTSASSSSTTTTGGGGAGAAEASGGGQRQGYIVVETNYRVYAYTNSDLEVALLALFCDIMYRFPNMVVCQLTRENVRRALQAGITAEQIIGFLRMNAHPQMYKKLPVLPAVIVDQIMLWELERARFTFTEGVLYDQFLSNQEFEVLRDHAKETGVLVWDNPQRRMMVVSRSGHDDVKRFWKRQKQNS